MALLFELLAAGTAAFIIFLLIAFLFLYPDIQIRREFTKPGTIIEVGWGHGYLAGGRMKIDRKFYHIEEVGQTWIRIGERE